MFETTRLFVGNLPLGVSESDLKEAFSFYGKIISAEVKQKKDVYENVEKKGFAFVTLQATAAQIDQCIQEFTRNKWNGETLNVSRARESFMERLKKEREEGKSEKRKHTDDKSEKRTHDDQYIESTLRISPVKSQVEKSSEKQTALRKSKRELPDTDATFNVNKKQRMEDTLETEADNVVKDQKLSTSDAKRLNSMKEMRNAYNSKKSIIQQSLSNVDKKVNSKIKFGSDDDSDSTEPLTNGLNHKRTILSSEISSGRGNFLFDENDDANDEDLNFDVKQQYEGKKGQKLLELRSRYKSDKRFILDERFQEGNGDKESNSSDENEGVELTADDEKTRNLDLLKDVLGIDVSRPKNVNNGESSTKKRTNMFRFDPTRPEHEKFIHPNENQLKDQPKKSKKERRKERENRSELQKGENDQMKTPDSVQVSQETFYNVNVQFTQTPEESAPFSLLSMYGNKNNEDNEKNSEADVNNDEYSSAPFANTTLKRNRNPLDVDPKNPFKYDTSDSENENDDDKKHAVDGLKNMEKESQLQGGPRLETFFFVKHDKRLKEGLEFFADMSTIHQKMRREMREIVKKRLSNNERKNSKKLFKKKIGGRRQQFSQHKKPRKVK